MMLAHQCSARAYLAIVVGAILTVFLLTTSRLQSSPAALSHLAEDAWNKLGDTQNPAADNSDIDEGAASGFCGDDLRFLRSKELGLSDNIVYTRRCIKPAHSSDVDRDEIANISRPLISGTTTLNLKTNCAKLEPPPPCQPLTLHVPPAYPEHHNQYRHLMFSVASTYERLQESLPVFAHWLSGTGAQLVLVVSDADVPERNADLGALQAAYHDANISATITAPALKVSLPRLNNLVDSGLSSPAAVEQLHFLLIRDMLEIATPETEWLGVLDDDTFFPALHPLSVALRQHDHKKPRWLGAIADNWTSMKVWGYMAYGGAGTFLSVPLAKQLDPYLETCIRETSIPSGDGMLKDCIYAYTTTKLTIVDGLYQHDIRGDPSGFFENGRRVLSIHHWKSWYRAPVDKMAAVADVCGDCFLQRWRFGEDTLLANGYSITVYRDGVHDLDLDRVEGTFDDPDGKFDFVYAPFRRKLPADEKKSYRLVGVDGDPNKGEKLKQVYVNRAPRDGKKGKMVDEVVELVWE
jgi:hypothetical protein